MSIRYLISVEKKLFPEITAESGRNRHIKNTIQAASSKNIKLCSFLTSFGRYPVFFVFCTNVFSFADTSKVIDAITKPNSIPETVAIVDIIG